LVHTTTGKSQNRTYPSISLILSGHILIGANLNIQNGRNLFTAGLYKGILLKPTGIRFGYHHYFSESRHRFSIGVEAQLMTAKDNQGRKYLPFIALIPSYEIPSTSLKFRIGGWIAFFPTRDRIATVALEGATLFR
jgi:hypothetical protein